MNDDNPKTNRSILPVQIREMREKVSAPSGIVRVHESVVVSIVVILFILLWLQIAFCQ